MKRGRPQQARSRLDGVRESILALAERLFVEFAPCGDDDEMERDAETALRAATIFYRQAERAVALRSARSARGGDS